jgi:hypothetical protein
MEMLMEIGFWGLSPHTNVGVPHISHWQIFP